MKTQTITLIGTQKYWAHGSLNRLIQERTKWDQDKVKQFLIDSQTVMFHKQTPESAKELVRGLEQAGFELDVQDSKAGIRIALSMSYESELANLRTDLETISKRITQLESLKGVSEVVESQADHVEKIMIEKPRTSMTSFFQNASHEQGEKAKKTSTEENIGKHWLSRIGIFTLLLGVVFLITYTSRSLGAWGKLAIGAAIGTILLGVGNFIARKQEYFKWAMATIGGGWAILYFTVFAAYHVPIVKVIQSPVIGLSLLLFISIFSIMQSLHFKSAVLVFMSYFLAFIAMVTTDVTFYTLCASFFIAISIVIVSKRLNWNWLAFLGLVIVYGTHWVWLEPSIYWAKETFAGQERFIELLYVPWFGDDWKVYPIIDYQKSILHLAFLVLYWILFTSMGYLQNLDEKKSRVLTSWFLLINSFIFTASFIHHLHVYYPDMKYLFAGLMACVFFGMSVLDLKRGYSLLSDIYLGFTVALGSLMLPLYFDGSAVTYGWSVAAPVLLWLGIRHQRNLLRWASYALGIIVLIRIVSIDYLDLTPLLTSPVSVNAFLPLALLSSVALFILYRLTSQLTDINNKERDAVTITAYISSVCLICSAFMIGGLREYASPLWLLLGFAAMANGIVKQIPLRQITGAVLIVIAAIRFMSIDTALKMKDIFHDPIVMVRYGLSVSALFLMLYFTEWVRTQITDKTARKWYFGFFSIAAALFFLNLSSDKAMTSSLSLIWGIGAMTYIIFGFRLNEKVYRWIGLALFVLVIAQLFLHDFAKLEMLYRIISFMGLGAVLIVASLIYGHYSKILLNPKKSEDI